MPKGERATALLTTMTGDGDAGAWAWPGTTLSQRSMANELAFAKNFMQKL